MFYVVRDIHRPSHTQRETIEAHDQRDDAYRSVGEHATILQRHGFAVTWWSGEPSFVARALSGDSSVAIYVREA